MRTPLIAGNWKMYQSISQAIDLTRSLVSALQGVDGREVAICPPFTALYAVGEALRGSSLQLGAQNLYPEAEGAYTGEISPRMLVDVGCRYVILGHSERRQHLNESDEFIQHKVQVALAHGLRPILCVGETLAQREQGEEIKVVSTQLRADLRDIQEEQMPNLAIAYEPVWAIGTGRTATPKQAQTMQRNIREMLVHLYGEEVAESARILYGGSVRPENIDELMAQPDIDGALVGGASLEAEAFVRIVRYRS